jgi:hypothetical protein
MPNQGGFTYQDCSGIGRLGFAEIARLNPNGPSPVFPEARFGFNQPVQIFFSNSRFQIQASFSSLKNPILKKGFLISISPSLVFSPGQVLQLGKFRTLPISIFPFFPFDLFLSTFFFLVLFQNLTDSTDHPKSANS